MRSGSHVTTAWSPDQASGANLKLNQTDCSATVKSLPVARCQRQMLGSHTGGRSESWGPAEKWSAPGRPRRRHFKLNFKLKSCPVTEKCRLA